MYLPFFMKTHAYRSVTKWRSWNLQETRHINSSKFWPAEDDGIVYFCLLTPSEAEIEFKVRKNTVFLHFSNPGTVHLNHNIRCLYGSNSSLDSHWSYPCEKLIYFNVLHIFFDFDWSDVVFSPIFANSHNNGNRREYDFRPKTLK